MPGDAVIAAVKVMSPLMWRRTHSPDDHRPGPLSAAEPVAPGLIVMPDRLQTIGALSRLSAQHREVIHQAHYLGRTTVEIAADLDITEYLVKSMLHNALHSLAVHP